MASKGALGSGTGGVDWVRNTLRVKLDEFTPEIDSRIAVLVDRQKDVGVRYMKEHAPWTDRTGNARATLDGKVKHSPRSHSITFFGGMPYQIFLELLQAGRFAIILPATRKIGADTMALARMLLERS
jgi:hypothetical protein